MNCDRCKRHGISCTGGETVMQVCERNGMYHPITNSDKIRAMSDEELAVLLGNTEANFPPNAKNGVSVKLCTTAWLDWLRQEAKE